jgi:hypothetical protein
LCEFLAAFLDLPGEVGGLLLQFGDPPLLSLKRRELVSPTASSLPDDEVARELRGDTPRAFAAGARRGRMIDWHEG